MNTIKLEWKEFNINMSLVDEWAKANLSNCCGVSANTTAEVHFTEQPSEDDIAALELYWESLDEESDEAQSYKPLSQIKAEAAAAKEAALASASAKLEALGFSEEEIKATLGR